MEVWLLWHTHSVGEEDDEKLVGVYSSRRSAEAARQRMIALPGFREAPDGFGIDSYVIDQDRWTGGFASFTPTGTGQ
ncbi:MAG TPA: hypothetical protein VMF30_13830 [Pirellulales bacterium]|nr:hypothetical protein [Pirellulales bacterium]